MWFEDSFRFQFLCLIHVEVIIIKHERLQQAAGKSHTANCVYILYICKVLGHLSQLSLRLTRAHTMSKFCLLLKYLYPQQTVHTYIEKKSSLKQLQEDSSKIVTIFHYCVSISNQLWSEVSRKLYNTNLCGLFIVITSKKKDQYDHKSLFQLLVPYDSSSVLSYLNKYFHQIRLKIHKSSFIKKNHIFQFIVLFCYSFQMQLFKRNNKIKRMCKNVY